MNERPNFQLPLLDGALVVAALLAIMVFEFVIIPGDIIASLA